MSKFAFFNDRRDAKPSEQTGKRVRHDIVGPGTIVGESDDHYKVRFDDQRKRKPVLFVRKDMLHSEN